MAAALRAAAAVGQHPRQSGAVDAEHVGEVEGLERHGDERGEQEVVDELRHLTAAERSEVDDRIAVGLEDLTASVEVGVLAPDHHDELACARRAAARRSPARR